jgi:hypothetical protein
MRSDLSSTRPPSLSPPQLLSETLSLLPSALPQTFSSRRNGVGSVDWPPTGSALVPEGGNAEHDDGIGVQVSNIALAYMWAGDLLKGPKEHGVNDVVLSRKRLLSPVRELEEISPDHSLAEALDKRKPVNGSSSPRRTLIIVPQDPQCPTIILKSIP